MIAEQMPMLLYVPLLVIFALPLLASLGLLVTMFIADGYDGFVERLPGILIACAAVAATAWLFYLLLWAQGIA